MKMEVLKYTDIISVTSEGIAFANHNPIIFSECIREKMGSGCIAERNIDASPAYFDFYPLGILIRIVFDKRGLFSANRNRKAFLHLQRMILSYGYTTYDLS